MQTPPDQPRLSLIDPATATADQAQVIARLGRGRGRIPTPYHIWLHSPQIAAGMEVIGTRLDHSPDLPPAEAEVVILATALHWQSPYVIANHLRHAASAGVPAALVADLRAGRRPRGHDARLQAVCDVTAAALAGGAMDDAAFAAHVAELGRATLAEILALIGYFTAVCLALRMHDIRPAPHQLPREDPAS